MKKTLKKIKTFFKKRKKIFKPILFFVGSVFSLIIIACIVGIIATGGFKNFEERARFEIIVFQERNDACSNPQWKWWSKNKFGEYLYKSNTQFIDYFKEKPDKFIKDIISLKNDDLLEFDYCSAFRHAIKAAHKGNQIAKDFLASAPFTLQDIFITGREGGDEDYILWKYIKELDENRLYNPAMVNAYAWGSEKKDKDKINKIHKQAAEDGYLQGMEDYLWTLYSKEKVNKTECSYILKYAKHLSDEYSLLPWVNLAYGNMGRTDQDGPRIIYKCLDKKTDFARTIELFKRFKKFVKDPKKQGGVFNTVYPALIYFNGWGNVEKNKDLAIELFLKNIENEYSNEISKAYLALVKLNEQDSKSNEEGTRLLNEIFDKDFSVLSNDAKIKYVKSFIKIWIEDWFKNPELVKTLNLYG